MTVKALFPSFVLVALLALTGCAKTEIVSAKSSSYDRTPQRLFVVAALGAPFRADPAAQPPTDPQTWFRSKLIAVLQSCGISSEVELVSRPSPAAPGPSPQAFALNVLFGLRSDAETSSASVPADPLSQHARAFAPDAVLMIQLVSVIMSGRDTAAYHLEMTDPTSNQVVWQADQTITSGSDFAYLFEKSFIGQMVKDKILPASCVAE